MTRDQARSEAAEADVELTFADPSVAGIQGNPPYMQCRYKAGELRIGVTVSTPLRSYDGARAAWTEGGGKVTDLTVSGRRAFSPSSGAIYAELEDGRVLGVNADSDEQGDTDALALQIVERLTAGL